MRRRALLGLVLGVGACRAVLGIDDRPVLDPDAGAPAAEDAAPEAGPSYCDGLSPAPLFCADFDEGSLERGWENDGKTPDPGAFGGGVIEEDTTVFRSAPRSVAFGVPARVTSTSTSAAFLLTRAPFVPSAIRLDVDLRVATEDMPSNPSGRVILASIHFAPAGDVIVFRDALGTALGLLDDTAGGGTTAAFSERIAVGTWRTLTIHVANMPTDGGPDGWANAAVDQIVAATLRLPATFQKVTQPPTISVGVPLARGPMGAFRVNVDDVRVYALE